MKSPLVSIIIPVYNGQKTLSACLQSVCQQTYDPYEIIVVDNHSLDETKQIIESFQQKKGNIKYIFEPIRRRGAARYSGEMQAKGDIILMTDADCVVPSDWVERMVTPILGGKEVAVQGLTKPIHPQNYWSRHYQREKERSIKERLSDRKVGLLDTANFAVKADVLKQIGYTNPNLFSGNDTELMARLILNGDHIGVVPVEIVHHHPESGWVLFKKMIYRGQWDRVIRKQYEKHDHLFLGWGWRDDIWFFRCVLLDLVTMKSDFAYNFIAGIGWRIGRFLGSFKNL